MSQAPTSQIFTTRQERLDALRSALAQAAAQGCRELLLCDVDFADWPLGERAVIETFTQWVYSHRRLTLLAMTYDEVVRRHPRFVDWRRQWSHIMDCRACTEGEASEFPSMLIASGVVTVRVLDLASQRTVVSTDRGDELRARELVDAFLQRSEPSFAATITGL